MCIMYREGGNCNVSRRLSDARRYGWFIGWSFDECASPESRYCSANPRYRHQIGARQRSIAWVLITFFCLLTPTPRGVKTTRYALPPIPCYTSLSWKGPGFNPWCYPWCMHPWALPLLAQCLYLLLYFLYLLQFALIDQNISTNCFFYFYPLSIFCIRWSQTFFLLFHSLLIRFVPYVCLFACQPAPPHRYVLTLLLPWYPVWLFSSLFIWL